MQREFDMEENIQELFKHLNDISVRYLMGVDRNNAKGIREEIPKIQQFVLWFLEGNRFGIDQGLYQEMSAGLLVDLEDIVEALQQEDHVLLHDAVAYGLLEKLKLFTEQEGKTNDGL